jgi:hypothetical protein
MVKRLIARYEYLPGLIAFAVIVLGLLAGWGR